MLRSDSLPIIEMFHAIKKKKRAPFYQQVYFPLSLLFSPHLLVAQTFIPQPFFVLALCGHVFARAGSTESPFIYKHHTGQGKELWLAVPLSLPGPV